VTLEGGLGFEFRDIAEAGDRFTIKGSYWTTDAKNFIDLDVIADGCFPPFIGGCFSQFNNKNAELDGVEVELKYDAPGWYTSAGFTHIDGIDTDTGLYLGVLQPDKFVIDTGVKLPEMWTRLGTRLTFADRMTKVNDPGEVRDAYTLIDVYAVIEPGEGAFKGFRLDLGIDNIMDTDYEVIAAGVVEEGINFKAALSWTQKW
jgi:hemoglobin/transferrin/lactoferrin receptor protein